MIECKFCDDLTNDVLNLQSTLNNYRDEIKHRDESLRNMITKHNQEIDDLKVILSSRLDELIHMKKILMEKI